MDLLKARVQPVLVSLSSLNIGDSKILHKQLANGASISLNDASDSVRLKACHITDGIFYKPARNLHSCRINLSIYKIFFFFQTQQMFLQKVFGTFTSRCCCFPH